MAKGKGVLRWPALRQVAAADATALGNTAFSRRTTELMPRTAAADKVVPSVCPYCGVGCGQQVYVKDGKILDIEGDYDSPISRGCLCPKGGWSPAPIGCTRSSTAGPTAPGGSPYPWNGPWPWWRSG